MLQRRSGSVPGPSTFGRDVGEDDLDNEGDAESQDVAQTNGLVVDRQTAASPSAAVAAAAQGGCILKCLPYLGLVLVGMIVGTYLPVLLDAGMGRHQAAAKGPSSQAQAAWIPALDDELSSMPQSYPCVFIQDLDMHQDRYLIDVVTARTRQDCCIACHKDERCHIAISSSGQCFLRKVIIGESESYRRPNAGVAACVVENRTANLSLWGPAAWQRDAQACRAKQQKTVWPLPNITEEFLHSSRLPNIVWHAYQVLAKEARTRMSGKGSNANVAEESDLFGLVKPILPLQSDVALRGLVRKVATVMTSPETWDSDRVGVMKSLNTAEFAKIRLCVNFLPDPRAPLKVAAVFLELQDAGFWACFKGEVGDKCSSITLANVYFNQTAPLAGEKRMAVFPPILWTILNSQSRPALKALGRSVRGTSDVDITKDVFEAVQVALPFAPPILNHAAGVGFGQGEKNLVGMTPNFFLEEDKHQCVVYGIGISGDSAFEQQMAALGCETHAFDCTIAEDSPAVVSKQFTFHHWCIGEKVEAKVFGQEYSVLKHEKKFKTLKQTMDLLGHTRLNVLKFDIEGFEWSLFEEVLLKDDGLRIEQLTFELHTEMAVRAFVPKELSMCRGSDAVAELFYRLYAKGYRTTSKEVNNGDPACAEFVMLNVNL